MSMSVWFSFLCVCPQTLTHTNQQTKHPQAHAQTPTDTRTQKQKAHLLGGPTETLMLGKIEIRRESFDEAALLEEGLIGGIVFEEGE